MWSPNELLKIEKQRDILSYITLQFFHFKKVPLEHCPLPDAFFEASYSVILAASVSRNSSEIHQIPARATRV